MDKSLKIYKERIQNKEGANLESIFIRNYNQNFGDFEEIEQSNQIKIVENSTKLLV